MSATVTQPQKAMIRELLQAGRWRNESEVVRYGLELVRREVEREQMIPLTDAATRESYLAMTADEITADHAQGAASLAAQKGKL